jgi:hypothetical protein
MLSHTWPAGRLTAFIAFESVDLTLIAMRLASKGQSPVNRRAPRIAREMDVMDLMAIAVRVAGLDTSVVRKSPGKDEWCVRSESNPGWSGGCYDSKTKADDRLGEVEAAKHAKNAAPGRPVKGPFLKKVPPSQSPYKSDDEAKKTLPKAPAIKPPRPRSDEPSEKDPEDDDFASRLLSKKPEPKPHVRDVSDKEYDSVDAFIKFKWDNDDGEFDFIDLQNLNTRTNTPSKDIRKKLEDNALIMKERSQEKKPRGISDNPHGTSPFSGMSGGGAYDSVLDAKYGQNPFTKDRGYKPPKEHFKTYDKE